MNTLPVDLLKLLQYYLDYRSYLSFILVSKDYYLLIDQQYWKSQVVKRVIEFNCTLCKVCEITDILCQGVNLLVLLVRLEKAYAKKCLSYCYMNRDYSFIIYPKMRNRAYEYLGGTTICKSIGNDNYFECIDGEYYTHTEKCNLIPDNITGNLEDNEDLVHVFSIHIN